VVPITNISTQMPVPAAIPMPGEGSSTGFQDLLAGAIQNVELDGANSQKAAQQFLSGDSDDIHKAAIAAQRADLSSSLFLALRNKVISAYQEIMKMQM